MANILNSQIKEDCPVCDSKRSEVFISEVEDYVFDYKGTWTLNRCLECNTLYLYNPLPESMVGKAYASYYTKLAPSRFSIFTVWMGIKQHILNWRFIFRSPITYHFLNWLTLGLLRKTNQSLRGLLLHESPKRVLDIGYGDGLFLYQAVTAGHHCYGIEFDEDCVHSATGAGFQHLGSSTYELSDHKGFFDLITCSHVLEHLYHPRDALRHCFEAMKPGAELWIETPNAESCSLGEFARYWRGLESPRHIFIPTWKGLIMMLNEAGFSDIHMQPKALSHVGMVYQSAKIRDKFVGRSHYPKKPSLLIIAGCMAKSLVNHNRTEFITLVARRPR